MNGRLPAAASFAARSPDHPGAPLRRGFLIKAADDEPSPLNTLMSSRSRSGGGRGGRQRLALLLTAIWVCSRPPHQTQRSASWWADMVGLPDPQSRASTRSVIANLSELAHREFIDFEPGRGGYAPIVTLRSELGTGAPYQRPHLDERPNYFRIPETLWTRDRLIGKLDARGLAMYLIMLSYFNANDHEGTWFSDKSFRARHGMAEATRLNGLNQLVNHGVVSMQQVFIDVNHGRGYRATRRRYYTLDPVYEPPATRAPAGPGRTDHKPTAAREDEPVPRDTVRHVVIDRGDIDDDDSIF